MTSAMKHFRDPGFFKQVVPDYLCRDDGPAAHGSVPASTHARAPVAGHLDALRRAYGPDGSPAQRTVHTARLPLQVPLILWAWSLGNAEPRQSL